jgi:hypothetical protein
MTDRRIDHTVSDCLCNDLLSLFSAFKAKLLLDISDRDTRVRNVDLLETELDDGVLKSVDQRQVAISLEELLVLDSQLLEAVHLSGLDTAHNREVRSERLLKLGLCKHCSAWDFSHQQLNDDEQFLDCYSETCGADLRTLSETLDEGSLGLRVLKLDSLDSADVVEVASILVVGAILWESGLRDEVACLLVQVLL